MPIAVGRPSAPTAAPDAAVPPGAAFGDAIVAVAPRSMMAGSVTPSSVASTRIKPSSSVNGMAASSWVRHAVESRGCNTSEPARSISAMNRASTSWPRMPSIDGSPVAPPRSTTATSRSESGDRQCACREGQPPPRCPPPRRHGRLRLPYRGRGAERSRVAGVITELLAPVSSWNTSRVPSTTTGTVTARDTRIVSGTDVGRATEAHAVTEMR